MNSPCGCGAAPLTPAIYNRPGLDSFACRIGDHGAFFQSMLDRLSSADYPALADLTTRDLTDPSIAMLDVWAVVGDILTFYQERIANEGYIRTATERLSISALADLVGYKLRPGVAASVYLAFTANPLAGSLDDDAEVIVEAGTQAQSVPGPGELPQMFETSAELIARPRWNQLTLRMDAPQTIAADSSTVYIAGLTPNLKQNDPLLVATADGKRIIRRIDSVAPQFDKGWTLVNLQTTTAPVAAQASDSTAVASIPVKPAPLPSPFEQLASLVTALALPPAEHPRAPENLPRSSSDIFKPESEMAPALLSNFNPGAASEIYAALANEPVTPAPISELNAFRVSAAPFGHNALPKLVFNDKGAITGSVEWPIAGSIVFGVALTVQVSRSFFGRETPVMVAGGKATVNFIATLSVSQSGGATPFQEAGNVTITNGVVTGSPLDLGDWAGACSIGPSTAGTPDSLTFDFTKPGFPSHQFIFAETSTGPTVSVDDETSPHPLGAGQTLQYTLNNGQVTVAFIVPASASDTASTIAAAQPVLRATYEVAQPPDTSTLALDAVYDQIIPGSWVILERPGWVLSPLVTTVVSVATVSKAAYGISGRVTVLNLHQPWGDGASDLMLSSLRKLSVRAQSENLPLASQPVTDDVSGATVELDGLYPGLKAGRWLIVEGERTDIMTAQSGASTTGVHGSELVMLSGVKHDATPALPGDTTHTTLVLSSALAYSYKRDSVLVHGNVAKATQGQSRAEILGNGDASQTFQQFELGQKPLTWVSSPTAAGVDSTLQIRVNDLLWHEGESLLDAGPNDRVYVTHIAQDSTLTVVFGDGAHSSRLSSGTANVRAVYRSGLGTAGDLDANQISQLASQPLGVSGVTNPQASTGGADAESGDAARDNAAVAAKALDRLVSVQDYADFSRNFAGIAKTSASVLSDGTQRLVYVTIAGEEDIPIALDSDLYLNLGQAMALFGDPNQDFGIGVREVLFLVISARVTIGADFDWSAVSANIRSALLDAFSFARRDLAQPVYASEVVTAIQSVAGVSWVSLEILDSVKGASIADDLARLGSGAATKNWVSASPARQSSDAQGNGTILPAQIAYLNPDVPDTLILNQGGA